MSSKVNSHRTICGFTVGNNLPFFLIAGPCVIESESLILSTAEQLKKITEELSIPLIFKSSFDKANRTSIGAFRGVGVSKGLEILAKVREQFDLPVITDVHDDSPLDEVSDVVDMLQTPAFLVRQTNFITRVCEQGLPVNIKKGQFQAPWDMLQVAQKAANTGNKNILLCERGTSFGYNTLVSDMRGLVQMRSSGCPIVFDATHSVQQPGGLGEKSGGQREMVAPLARAAIAVGVAGIFIETHPDPDNALCDGPNMWRLDQMKALLSTLKKLDLVIKS
jgi:2-dehydro-3-deoxyphosphooctonate aldolase (KDO 8-P synthase)